ncbi:MAG: DNA polymerase I, partial [Campylobacterales bacterium]
HFVDFQALVGDSSDNVPGVRGIGPKSAAALIALYPTLEEIYSHLDQITPASVRQKLADGRELAFLSRELVRLETALFPSFDPTLYALPTYNPILLIEDELRRYAITAILNKLTPSPQQPALLQEQPISPAQTRTSEYYTTTDSFRAILINNAKKLHAIIASIPEGSIVAIDTETDSLDTYHTRLVGFSFAWEEHTGYYVPIAHNYLGVGAQVELSEALHAMALLLKHPYIGHNLKFDLGVLLSQQPNLQIPLPHADTMILAWLLNPEGSHGLDHLVHYHLGHEMIRYSQTVKKGETFASVPLEEACRYSAEDALMTLRLYHKLLSLFPHESGLVSIMHTIEMPFLLVLLAMERAGIAVDQERLKELLIESREGIDRLRHEIFALAGSEFNLNSTQQLATILYDHLGLKAGKKTKTGRSTDEKSLQALINDHPIIEKILDYRELFKLKSTYIEPLIQLAQASDDGRVRTTFLQTGTATGRLSSRNPNLQNIPVRTLIGRRIRDGFIARPGFSLVGIDYSQIELRLLAHFTQDPVLTDAFRHGRDIHLETARRLFGDERAQEMRPLAKTINFGILYGMGSRKLAETLSIPTKEAKTIIDNYFASFPTVEAYFDSIRRQAKEEGFVQTLAGRRRLFDFTHANPMQEAMYLREAVNTLFQGSAADIIKMAMIRIYDELLREGSPAQMLLQIHDELIFEVPEADAITYGMRFRNIMENIVKLHVPLRTSMEIASSWGGLK